MILLIHVIIALSSVASTTYSVFRPSKRQLYASYALVVLTLATGTYLVVSTGSPLLQACTTGLIYLAIVSSGLFAAHQKLAKNVL